ncbi:MAG: hypothetical protein LQ343_005968 [Gyalolechia ehrenbergii]|nr:MAG: hypothetical protein LQ343_005968 [Gyalolechia ehrenbergii]
MAYFIPSYFQKRILRYALSRLDLLDSEQLDLDNLDIAWGKRSVVELRNLGVHLKKITSLLKLPPQLVLVKASIKLLRITVPADLYSSGIVAEIEGIDVLLDADTRAQKDSADTQFKAREYEHENVPKHISVVQSKSHQTKFHDPGGEPRGVVHGIHGKDESSDPGVLRTTDDLAKSFLQAEPEEQKAELQAAVAQSQHLEESEVLDVSGQSSVVGVGNGLSLPAFLSGFLKGIGDRFSLKIQDIKVDIFLRIELPFESSSTMVASERSENVTLRLSIKELNYRNVLDSNFTADDRSNRSGRAVSTSSTASLEGQRWVRQIIFSNIQGTIMSDASIFSSLLPSPTPSSTSESIVAGVPIKARQKTRGRDNNLGRNPTNVGDSVDLSHLLDTNRDTTPPRALPPPRSQRPNVSNELHPLQNQATIPTTRDPKLASIMEQCTPQKDIILDLSYSDEGASRSEHNSTGDFRSSRRQRWPGPLDDSTSSSLLSYNTQSYQGLSHKVRPEREQASNSDERRSEPSMAAGNPLPDLQYTPSPPDEDLAASKIFSHEEAESMYMSAMSNRDAEKEGATQVVPGAWKPYVEDNKSSELATVLSAHKDNKRDHTGDEFRESGPTSLELEHPNVTAVRLPPSDGTTNTTPKSEESNITYLDEPISITETSAVRPTILESPYPSDSGTEGSLIVAKPFLLIDYISFRIPHSSTSPAVLLPSTDQPEGTTPASYSSTFQPGHSTARYDVKGTATGGGRKRSDHAAPDSIPESGNPMTDSATSVTIGAIQFNTDMGLAKLTALIVRQVSKVFPAQKSAGPKRSSAMSASQTEMNLEVDKITWQFYDRVVGLPVVDDVSRCTHINREDALAGPELLLQATVQRLESFSQATANSYKSKVTMTRIAFGYASGSILSFDSALKLRESSRDSLAPVNKDLVLTISKDPQVSKIELSTLPIQMYLDLRRLDETFAWLGGFSSILDLGNSMISTVTTLDPIKSSRKRERKVNRGVHFEIPHHGGSESTNTPQKHIMRKITARFGGVTCTLLGSESSLLVEGTAVKVVSRAEGLGLQVDRINISGPCLKEPGDRPAVTVQLFNVRAEYLPEPKEVDLARLLALLSPSRDKYGVDDDILLDTLLRQRRQGSVIRLTAERSETCVYNINDLRHFSTLSEELKKLATVAKYLPDDDRPGILTLALIRQFRCKAQINQLFGPIDADLKNIELAHITLPSLLALGVSGINIRRDGDEELVTAASPLRGPEESPLPMIMARFVGNEMEPTVKLKLYNICVEYHVPFILAIMRLNGSAQPEEVLTDMAESIAILTERTRSQVKPAGSPRETSCSSDESPNKFTTLKVDITIRDSLVGLNPRNSPSKGIVLLTETHFAGAVPKDQEANATLEVRKATLMIIDDQKNIKPPETNTQAASAQSNVSHIQALEAMGYVSISSVSAAGAVLQVTQPQESTSRSIDVEIKDDLFVLETCADSTQTLQEILNGLAPPLPPSQDVKYRTEIVPIENMLSSFSGMAFTSDGARMEDAEEDGSQPAVDPENRDDEDLQGSLYDLESSRQYNDVPESMLDEESDSVIIDQSAQVFGAASSILGVDEQAEDEIEGLPLDFHGDHFGSNASVGGTAHRWNTKHNNYGLSNESALRRSPLRVKIRDVHVIWNLFDGYDWQRTRDTINQAIADVETKALVQQSKREKLKPHDTEDEEESVIGDFLFNSIYIGVPANRDPRNLARQVSRNLDDIASESESSVATTISNTARHPSTPSPARSKRPRLARSKHHKMTFELKGLSADVVVFAPGSGETQSSVDIRVQNMEIFDHVPTSTWKKFATYMQDAGERESGSSMIHVEMLNVRPVADLAASEIILKATILPIRLHVDQDALDFMTRFFEFKNDDAKEATTKSEAAFLQRVEVYPVRLRLDFKPKRVDYAGIRSGHTNEFMNFFILDRADMVLRHVIIYGISGFDRLGKTLNDIWMPDIKRNQLPGVLAGLAPVRSLVNVGGGVRDLVVVPIREYRKDGRIVRSLQKGALAFAKTTTSELVKLGAKLAIGTQTVLQGAEDLLTQPEKQRSEAVGGWEEAELAEDEKKHISLYADQPVGVVQGLRGAYASLERDLLTAKDAIVAMPGEIIESGTAGGAAKAVLRSAPTVILRPALGVSKAVGRTLMGATNSLDPENRRRIEECYTQPQLQSQQQHQYEYEYYYPPPFDSQYQSQPESPFESHLDCQIQSPFENPDQPQPDSQFELSFENQDQPQPDSQIEPPFVYPDQPQTDFQFQCQLKYQVASQLKSPFQLQPGPQFEALFQRHLHFQPHFPPPSQALVQAQFPPQGHLPQPFSMQPSSLSTQGNARPIKTRLTLEQRRQNHIRSECQRREDLKAAFTQMTRCVPGLNEDSVRNEGYCLLKFMEFGKEQLEKRKRLIQELADKGVDVEKVLQVSKLEDDQHDSPVDKPPQKKKKATGPKRKRRSS